MKLTLESEFSSVTIENKSAVVLSDVFEMFKGAVLAHQFQPETLDDLILELAEEIEIRKEAK
jgi:hypothetical protein